MNIKEIPICDSLQNLALKDSLPDGIYLTKSWASVRKVNVIEGIVSLYSKEKDLFINRFSQSHFFEVNKIISRLNNKKWKQKARINKAMEI